MNLKEDVVYEVTGTFAEQQAIMEHNKRAKMLLAERREMEMLNAPGIIDKFQWPRPNKTIISQRVNKKSPVWGFLLIIQQFLLHRFVFGFCNRLVLVQACQFFQSVQIITHFGAFAVPYQR